MLALEGWAKLSRWWLTLTGDRGASRKRVPVVVGIE